MEMVRELSKVCDVCSNATMYADDVSAIIEIMKTCNLPWRCKDISPMMKEKGRHSSVSHIAKMLGFAKDLGLVVRTEVEGEPIEIEVAEYHTFGKDGKPDTVVVDGITYRRTDSYHCRGKWVTVKRTIVPKIAMYSLA